LIDEIEIKFIPDYNTLVANILAGTVELTLGRSLSLEQAVPVRDQWRDGRMDLGALSTWIAIYPQFINPSPAIIANLQFRRAIYHAMDRQQMAEEFMLGLSPVAHSIIPPGDAEYPHVESRIVRYEYDLRRAAQLIEGLGYIKGADGAYRDAAGQPLVVQTQTSVGNALQEKSMFAVGEYLKRIGVGVDPDVVSAQARSDRARRAARSGFEVQKQPAGIGALPRYHGNSTPVPENNFVGNNRSRYRDAGYDALLDQFYATILVPERMAVLGQIVQHMTDQLNVIGLIYDMDPTMVGHRLQNVAAPAASGATVGWNAHLWNPKGP
jgi:peptide/nickel transport system substrate-binding protein